MQKDGDLAISFIPQYTVVFEQTDTAVKNFWIPNTTAHEAGHWVDYLYERAPNAAYITVGGTKTTGDVVSVTITNSHIVGSPLKVSYTVGAGDTLSDIATGLAGAVNFTAALNTSTVHIVGTASAAHMSIDAVLPSGAAISTYTTAGTTYAVSVGTGATETLTSTVGVLPSTGAHASDSTLFADELAQDWTNFNALSPCGGTLNPNSGIFSGRQDLNLKYICTGVKGVGATLSTTAPNTSEPYSNTTTYPNNKAILTDTLNMYGDIFVGTTELFPEEFAVLVSKTDQNYSEGPNTGAANPTSRDYYLQTMNSFLCTQFVVSTMTSAGNLPSGYPSNCPKQ
jgi:hypothetical protein